MTLIDVANFSLQLIFTALSSLFAVVAAAAVTLTTTTTTTLVVILCLPSDALSVARLLRDARVYSTVLPVTPR